MGITGHRSLAEVDRVSHGVDRALDGIEGAFSGRRLVALSALAEGADRLAALQVLARPGAGLVAVLPLPEEVYRADFRGPGSQQEFADLLSRAARLMIPAGVSGREEAYEAAGRTILDCCQVLLAIWDGGTGNGAGGTGWVVAEARQRGLPLAWVHAGNRRPGGEEPVSLGDEQGTVTFERFPNLHKGN